MCVNIVRAISIEVCLVFHNSILERGTCICELAMDAMGLEVVIKFVGDEFHAYIKTNKLDRVLEFLLHHEVPSTKPRA